MLGNLKLNLTGNKSMSLFFLYRLISSMTQAKMQSDLQKRRALLDAVRAAPASAIGGGNSKVAVNVAALENEIEMPQFVVAKTYETYGIPALAKRYLAEMAVGLHAHSEKSLRLQIFTLSLGLDGGLGLDVHGYSHMLSVLHATVTLMDNERGVTRMRKDQFFARFGEFNELFMPREYLVRGLLETVEAELNSEYSERFVAAIEHRMAPHLLRTVAECEAEARGMKPRRKAAVLGANFRGPFVSVDRFLWTIVSEHRDATVRRSQTVRAMIKKYDNSGDGLLQLEEFRSMIKALSPNLQPALVERLWEASGGSGQFGSIDSLTLEVCLFDQEWRSAELYRARSEVKQLITHKEATSHGTEEAMHRDEERAHEELTTIANLWDEVKDGAKRIEQIEDYLGDWQTIVRVQAWVRGSNERRHRRGRVGK